MSTLSSIKKQIAALQAQADRVAKDEASSAVAKIKKIMADFNLTIEHLTSSVTRKPAAKKQKARAASVAKYADPKTGKTWSGFGRAPGWIAGAKNREAFLVDKSGITVAAPAAAEKAPVKVAKAVKVAKTAAKKAAKPAGKRMKEEATAAAAAKTAAKAPATKPAAAKKAAKPKAPAKKVPARKASESVAAPTPVESTAPAA